MARMSPLGALLCGAAAGAVGTVAMDGFWYARYRAQGGDDPPLAWEFGGPSDWDHVSAPAQVGRRLYEGVLHRPLEARWARLANNVMHWSYGIAWGTAFGLAGASLQRTRAWHGALFGTGVWASDYVSLPLIGIYKPVWEYSVKDLAPDVVAHVVYGVATERVFRVMTRSA
jgi:hypothetical protein